MATKEKNPSTNLTSGMREKLLDHIAHMDATPEERKKAEAAFNKLLPMVQKAISALFPPEINDIMEAYGFISHGNSTIYILPPDHNERVHKSGEIDIDHRNRKRYELHTLDCTTVGVIVPVCKRFPQYKHVAIEVDDKTWAAFVEAKNLHEAHKATECSIKKAYSDLVKRTKTVDSLEKIWPGSAAIAGEPQVAISNYSPADIVAHHRAAIMGKEAK